MSVIQLAVSKVALPALWFKGMPPLKRVDLLRWILNPWNG